jgi:hypothetical protein
MDRYGRGGRGGSWCVGAAASPPSVQSSHNISLYVPWFSIIPPTLLNGSARLLFYVFVHTPVADPTGVLVVICDHAHALHTPRVTRRCDALPAFAQDQPAE